jgi:hypothetical protein
MIALRENLGIFLLGRGYFPRPREISRFLLVYYSYSRLLQEAWGTHILTSLPSVIMIIPHLIWSRWHQHSDGEEKKMTTTMMADDGRWEVQEWRSDGGGNVHAQWHLLAETWQWHQIVIDCQCWWTPEIFISFPSMS